MQKTSLIVDALALGAMAATAPAEARGFRGYGGASIGLGIAAGALAAGAYDAYGLCAKGTFHAKSSAIVGPHRLKEFSR